MTSQSVLKELYRRERLSYLLRPEQRAVKEAIEFSEKPLIVGNISRRYGKSFTLVLYATEQCLMRKEKIRYGAAFLSDLEEFILPAFYKIIDSLPEELKPHYIRSRKTWVFPSTGSEIKLVGLDKNPNAMRGNAISIMIIDEAGFVTHLKRLYTSVIIPATMKQKNIRLIFMSTPPESPAHYFVSLINRAKVDGTYFEFTIDDISDLEPEERKRVLDEVGGEESDEAQREFFCKIISDPLRAVCRPFNEQKHVKETPLPQHCLWAHVGDVGGVNDYFVAYLCAWDPELQKLIFWDEIFFPNRTPSSKIIAGAQAFERKLIETAGCDLTISRWFDAPGQLLVDFGFAGFSAALPPKDDFQAGLTLLRTTFHNDIAIVNPRCKLLISTLRSGLLNKQATDYERSEEFGHCDAAAAAIYAIRVVDRTDLRPISVSKDVWYQKKPDQKVQELMKMGWTGNSPDRF